MKNKQKKPKILIFDVETAPIAGYVWSLWQQNVGLNQILSDWYILSWSAKWLGEPASKIMHMNQGEAKDIEDDSKILKELWKLLNEADVVVTQNGKHFDEKRLNARFIIHGIRPPAPYKHIDTCQIAKHKFGFTSSKLEYLSGKLCKKYKKYPHNKYPGFALWAACLGGDPDVWEEMRKYNNFDVLATEELYTILKPWDSSVNLAVYQDNPETCACGGTYIKHGFQYSLLGKFQRFSCNLCGHWTRGAQNLFDKLTRQRMKRRV